MSLSKENVSGAKKLSNINQILWRRSLMRSPRRVRALAFRQLIVPDSQCAPAACADSVPMRVYRSSTLLLSSG
jgi:hypothetical protein